MWLNYPNLIGSERYFSGGSCILAVHSVWMLGVATSWPLWHPKTLFSCSATLAILQLMSWSQVPIVPQASVLYIPQQKRNPNVKFLVGTKCVLILTETMPSQLLFKVQLLGLNKRALKTSPLLVPWWDHLERQWLVVYNNMLICLKELGHFLSVACKLLLFLAFFFLVCATHN